MRNDLGRTLTVRANENKLIGLQAEIRLRYHLNELGFGDRVSAGGWIIRSTDNDVFEHVKAFFPAPVLPEHDYPSSANPPEPPLGLHTICATLHQLGIQSYFCWPEIESDGDPLSIRWRCLQLGIPVTSSVQNVLTVLDDGFTERQRRYNFRRYDTDTSRIPQNAVGTEFAKEHLRVYLHSKYYFEISDIDGLLWGQQHTYPIEIKEKTSAGPDNRLGGEWFGLDVGPFTKLAFYAEKRHTMHSLFIVHEIDDEQTRNSVEWWYITYDKVAKYASWAVRSGGTGMGGSRSAVIRIPKSKFERFDRSALESL